MCYPDDEKLRDRAFRADFKPHLTNKRVGYERRFVLLDRMCSERERRPFVARYARGTG